MNDDLVLTYEQWEKRITSVASGIVRFVERDENFWLKVALSSSYNDGELIDRMCDVVWDQMDAANWVSCSPCDDTWICAVCEAIQTIRE